MKLRVEEEEVPGFQMSPMIDIVFQLIIFFMLVSTFKQMEIVEGIKIPVANYSVEKETVPGELVINIKDDGVVIVNHREYNIDQLATVLAYTRAKHPDINYSVFIRADARTRHSDILEVMKACSRLGIYRVAFSALPE